ncbi:hypothetical protein [Actinopolymorpha alba]|uniref:hypothetical protein n=1 Tax=Actinopolymorpha alba TaxID=533267 RepID=UPI0003713B11|nr:hypothetical protein [Actinopolymorpha alba]
MTGDAGSALRVIDAPDHHRYEIVRDGTVVGYAGYQKTELSVLTFVPGWALAVRS